MKNIMKKVKKCIGSTEWSQPQEVPQEDIKDFDETDYINYWLRKQEKRK